MCFSPQRRAIFRHRNFKKWSETVSFLTFWLGNVLLATAACNFSTSQLQKVLRTLRKLTFWLGNALLATAACNFSTSDLQKVVWDRQFLTFWLGNVLLATAACNFSTSQLQKVLRTPQFFNILTWKCASRHSGVQFFHIWTSKSGLRPSVF